MKILISRRAQFKHFFAGIGLSIQQSICKYKQKSLSTTNNTEKSLGGNLQWSLRTNSHLGYVVASTRFTV